MRLPFTWPGAARWAWRALQPPDPKGFGERFVKPVLRAKVEVEIAVDLVLLVTPTPDPEKNHETNGVTALRV